MKLIPPPVNKWLRILLLGTFAFTIAANAYVDSEYAYNMPESPQPASGRIYRIMVNHGSIVYVNKRELARAHFVFHDLFNVGTASFFLAFFLTGDLRRLWQKARSRSRPSDST